MHMHSLTLSDKIKKKKKRFLSLPKYSFTHVVRIQNTVLCGSQVQT